MNYTEFRSALYSDRHTESFQIMNYSEFRSALYSDRHTEAFQIMNYLNHPDEKEIASKLWWQHVKPDLIAADLVWSGDVEGRSSLWYIDEEEWQLSLGSLVIATNETLDLQTIQLKWARTPARHILPAWEEWAEENAPEHLTCVRELLDLLDQEGQAESIIKARSIVRAAKAAAIDAAKAAASDAASDAAKAAAWAARAAITASHTTSDAAKTTASDVSAASDAAKAAAWAARAIVSDTASLAASDAEYNRWCLEWTKYVFSILKVSK